ncbi:MAG: hypothetical protein ACHQVS_04045 [Candidatus Babeliales bacterium]
MKTIRFDFTASMLTSEQATALSAQVIPEVERVKAAHKTGYETPYGCLNLAGDKPMINHVHDVVTRIKELNPSTLVVVGIGGSNLGTLAVQEALLGKFNRQKLKVYYADTVDSDYIHDILQLVEHELRSKRTVIVNIVSKSGTTTETIANGELFIALLQRYHGAEYHRFVVATTDKDSALWKLAHHERYTCLEIPRLVGGRYSVFSSVGLFPLGLMGIDTQQLCAGADAMRDACTHTALAANPALHSAVTLFAQYQQHKTMHDTFVFSVALESVGKWYRQLMGESIGKEQDLRGTMVNRGITPTVSVGSTDLHSVGQLYLGGPHDKVTTFITVERTHASCAVPEYPAFDALVPHIQGKSLSTIMDAIITGTQRAYANRSLPYMVITVPEISAWSVGQLLQMKMYEMIYLAYLMQVNPFDQPNVESYKQETRKILIHE